MRSPKAWQTRGRESRPQKIQDQELPSKFAQMETSDAFYFPSITNTCSLFCPQKWVEFQPSSHETNSPTQKAIKIYQPPNKLKEPFSEILSRERRKEHIPTKKGKVGKNIHRFKSVAK